MADQTPALARATEAVREAWGDANIDGHGDEGAGYDESALARAAVSAALHDPDDPDFGARELFVAESGQDRDFALRVWFNAPDDQAVKQHYRRMFDAVRAAILGSGS